MKVALFFDGKNFYTALRKYDPTLEIDYNRLASWLTDRISSGRGEFVGAYYYTGFTQLDQARSGAFRDFLKGLELQPGYFVKREPRVRRKSQCRNCGFTHSYGTEKRVDTRLVADMIHFAAVDAYDVAVLLSGDQDFVPAVEAANALGKRVYLAAWPRHGVSAQLRIRCYDQIHLADGIGSFSTGRPRVGQDTESIPPSDGSPQSNMIAEIARALQLHDYLSRGHFINRWRPQLSIPQDVNEREEMLDGLISEGKVIEEDIESNGNRFKTLRISDS